MTRNLLLDIAILLALAVFAVVAYKLAPLLQPKTDVLLPVSSCNLNQQACIATLPDGGQMEFSIEPRPIPALRPLQLQASFRGSDVRRVEVDLAGIEMKMGHNRPLLAAQAGDGKRFSGQASLPVCITGSMEWEATVLVDDGKTLIAVPFRFVSGN